jgi:hypothetical protein
MKHKPWVTAFFKPSRSIALKKILSSPAARLIFKKICTLNLIDKAHTTDFQTLQAAGVVLTQTHAQGSVETPMPPACAPAWKTTAKWSKVPKTFTAVVFIT